MAQQIKTIKCPTCGKVAKSKLEMVMGDDVMHSLECGHAIFIPVVHRVDYTQLVADNGHKLFPFQVQSCQFGEDSGLRCLFGHEMGLGKTVIAAALLKEHLAELTPTMIFCKAGLTLQTFMQVWNWTGQAAQILESTWGLRTPYFEHFKIFICSYDLFWRLDWAKDHDKLMEMASKFKCVILDETQMIKTPDSKRTQAIRRFVVEGNIPHVFGLSGTAIKNRPNEYWTILNMLRPTLFPKYEWFLKEECQQDSYGKIVGLKRPETFHEKVKPFVLRYKRAEVMPELPAIFRQFHHAEMKEVETEAYKQVVTEFNEYYDGLDGKMGSEAFTNILAYFSRMRHITGLSKIDPCIDFVEQFLLENEADNGAVPRKLTIFLHHKRVADSLLVRLTNIMKEAGMEPPLMLHSALSTEERQDIVDKFWKPEYRILIASTLASGEGLNLQCCSDAIILERQWNPANEEQAEARFPRPGSTASQVNVTYMIAAGTIDEFLTELVEKKRAIAAQTLDGKELQWEQQTLMRELMDLINTKGLQRWVRPM